MSEYKLLDKILHRQFLGEGQISEFLFERLLSKSKNFKNKNDLQYIFVLGLARAGTTALLNKIYQSNQFASFLYSHMPFVLSPKLANFFSNQSKNEDDLVIRYHNDGIYINKNSPECLDEIFWIKSNDKYFKESYIKNDNIDSSLLKSYDYLIHQFCTLQNKKRFVIKNNNNHVRIIELANYFKSSKFLILFREPLAHARSLLNQHLNFTDLQNKDDFILEYMNLIGHREFGNNVKPFIYKDGDQDWYKNLNKNSLIYWIKQWIETYSWLYNSLQNNFSNVYFICYESLCLNKESSYNLRNLLEIDDSKFEFRLGNYSLKENKQSLPSDLLKEASEIYSNLKDKSIL